MPAHRKPRLILFRDNREADLYHFEAVIGHNTVVATNVDRANGIIRRVAVITDGVTARGHGMEVDNTTVKQLCALGKKKGKVSVKLDHGSGMSSICGYLKNFAVEGKKLIADWFLLKKHKEYETTMERAEEMPECFGMSAAFVGGPTLEDGTPVYEEEKTGKQYTLSAANKKTYLKGTERMVARASDLRAVDCVTDPAANPGGLFHEKFPGVDNKNVGNMPGRKNTPAPEIDEEPTLADLARLMSEIKGGLDANNARLDKMEQAQATPAQKFTLDELEQMSDEELAQVGDGDITRADVEAAVAQAEAAIAEQNTADGLNPDGSEVVDGGAGAGAAVPAAVATALSSLQRTVNFMVRERNQEKRAAQEATMTAEFDRLDQQFEASQAEIIELRAKLEATETALKTGGGRALRPTSGGEVVLFNSKVGRQAAPVGSFEQIADARYQELCSKDKNLSDAAARSQAVAFAVKKHPDAYADYRQRHGKVQFTSLAAK